MTYYEKTIGDCRLILADCMDVLSGLDEVGAVVSDPPYGMKWDTDSTRYSGGKRKNAIRRQGKADWGSVAHDDRPFDPAPWMQFKDVILWGANHFGAHLPVGTTLVWLKRFDSAFESFLSDAEVAWKKGGHGVYCRRDLSMNHAKERLHPTQKPVGIMEWCVAKTSGVVLDPYMGAGTTAVACINLGRPFVGVEIERKYFEIACQRVEKTYRSPRLFGPEPQPQQEALL